MRQARTGSGNVHMPRRPASRTLAGSGSERGRMDVRVGGGKGRASPGMSMPGRVDQRGRVTALEIREAPSLQMASVCRLMISTTSAGRVPSANFSSRE